MHKKYQNILTIFLAVFLYGCSEQLTEKAHLPSKKYHFTDVVFSELPRREKVYVPVYSDIYHGTGENRFLLTVTLSIRNTSLQDPIYVNAVDYYDSHGGLIRKYLKRTVLLAPLESVEFVVENNEQLGGAGANFIVDWGARIPSLRPLIHAVMIGTGSQQGISFLTESVVLETHDQ